MWKSSTPPETFFPLLSSELRAASDQIAAEGPKYHDGLAEVRWLRLALFLRRVADLVARAGHDHPLLPDHDFGESARKLQTIFDDITDAWPGIGGRLCGIVEMLREIPRADAHRRVPMNATLAELAASPVLTNDFALFL